MSGLLVLFKLVARGIKLHLFDSKILKDDPKVIGICLNILQTPYIITKTCIFIYGLNKQSNSEIECNENHWIINGKVYDFSSFLDFHPGGRHILLMNRGRDCTELFFMYHLASPKNINNIISMVIFFYES